MNSVVKLAAKDFRINWKELIGSAVGIGVFAALLFFSSPARKTMDRVGLLFNFCFILDVLYSELLIVREKAKGTLALIRSMPVSATEIIGAKFTLQAVTVCLAFCGNLLVFAPDAFRDPGAILMQSLVLIVVGEALMVGRLIFNAKVALMAIFSVVLLLVLAYFQVAKMYPLATGKAVAALGGPLGTGIIGSFCACLCLLLLFVASKWLGAKDVSQLTD